MKHSASYRILIVLCFIICFGSCGSKDPESSQSTPLSSEAAGGSSAPGKFTPTPVLSSDRLRDNTPVVLTGIADGIVTYENPSAVIDASHTDEGYLMVSYFGTNPKVKLQIIGPNKTTYTYNLKKNGYEVFPLTSGSGTYTVHVFENIEGTSYSTLMTQKLSVTITNEFGPYLYANQYINFDDSTETIALAAELAANATNDLEVIELIYNYIITNFTYDYDKAATVTSGYLPVINDILSKKTGICFDYSAVMTSMLRTQRIPTRLEVGYVGEIYHAWISTYIEGHGWINGIIEFDGKDWKLMDPTSASASKTPKDFLTDSNNYLTKYIY